MAVIDGVRSGKFLVLEDRRVKWIVGKENLRKRASGWHGTKDGINIYPST
jgi:hypothetical protein